MKIPQILSAHNLANEIETIKKDHWGVHASMLFIAILVLLLVLKNAF